MRFADFAIWRFHIVSKYLAEELGGKVFGETDQFAQVWKLKAPYEVTEDDNIADGARTFSGATLSANNYDGEIRYISILPRTGGEMALWRKKNNSHYARTWGGGPIWISRIARRDALYGSSAYAQPSEKPGRFRRNPRRKFD